MPGRQRRHDERLPDDRQRPFALRALALYRSPAAHPAGKQYRVCRIDARSADFLEALSLPACAAVWPRVFETDAWPSRIWKMDGVKLNHEKMNPPIPALQTDVNITESDPKKCLVDSGLGPVAAWIDGRDVDYNVDASDVVLE
jgi:hypothetical protein